MDVAVHASIQCRKQCVRAAVLCTVAYAGRHSAEEHLCCHDPHQPLPPPKLSTMLVVGMMHTFNITT